MSCMLCLDPHPLQMLIKGIRSFSPDNSTPIEFYKPLTLIVGSNGAGKTVRVGSCMAPCMAPCMGVLCTPAWAQLHGGPYCDTITQGQRGN